MRRIGILTVITMVCLRLAIGWHFFHVGLAHYNDPKWTSEGFLRASKGPLADRMHAMLPPRPADKWESLLVQTIRQPMSEQVADAHGKKTPAKTAVLSEVKRAQAEMPGTRLADPSKKQPSDNPPAITPVTPPDSPAEGGPAKPPVKPDAGEKPVDQPTVKSDEKPAADKKPQAPSDDQPQANAALAADDAAPSDEATKPKEPAAKSTAEDQAADDKKPEQKSDLEKVEAKKPDPQPSEEKKSETPAKTVLPSQAEEPAKSDLPPKIELPAKVEATATPAIDTPATGKEKPAAESKPDAEVSPTATPEEKTSKPNSTENPVAALADKVDPSSLVEPAKTWYDQVAQDWQRLHEQFVGEHSLSDEQKTSVKSSLDATLARAVAYFDSLGKDAGDFQYDAERLYRLKQVAGTDSLLYQRERVTESEGKLKAKAVRWSKEIGEFEEQMRSKWNSMLTDDQRKAEPPAATAKLRKIDAAMKYLILGVGVCLILGLFTRLASVVGAGFLLSVVLSQPLLDLVTQTEGPGPYVPVEMFALLMLATTAVGRWGGLDFFIHYLIVRPIVARKETL